MKFNISSHSNFLPTSRTSWIPSIAVDANYNNDNDTYYGPSTVAKTAYYRRQRAAKGSMMALQAEERTKECDSRGELGDMGVVAGGGAESQDQEVRAQRNRRELGEEERRHRRRTRKLIYITHFLS